MGAPGAVRTATTGGHLALFGAAPDTGNLGVDALFHSVMAGVLDWDPSMSVSVFDNGFGLRRGELPSLGADRGYERVGLRRSRRVHRWEALARYRAAAARRGTRHPGVVRIREALAVLDISGGDSFSDIYGDARFDAVIAPKEVALKLGRPLVLLPQTYGPYRSRMARSRAAQVLQRAAQVWARDEDSLAAIHDLVPALDGAPHCRLGVDVAFALPPSPMPGSFGAGEDSQEVQAGVNVSGLLWQAGSGADFGLHLAYRTLMVDLVLRLIDAGVRVLLIPHVDTNVGTSSESDLQACEALREALPHASRERAPIVVGHRTASEAKSVISQVDWFVGARMHATIAGLSSDVATAAVAYSDKTAGVFASCGVVDQVVDARRMSTSEAVEHLWASFLQRDELTQRLSVTMPSVRDRASEQLHAALALAIGAEGPASSAQG